MKVSVSILKEKDNYIKAIQRVNESNADFLHLDILDNSFVKEESFNINDFKKIKINKKIDIHLMSNNLDDRINEFSTLNPEYIVIHEEVGDTLKYINKIKNKGIKVGLAINPKTDIENIYPYLELIDLILIMSVEPGKGGQEFMPEVIGKLQELREIQENYYFLISVDGGINNKTIKYVDNYVDIVVSGSYITNSNDYNSKVKSLKGE